MPFLLVEGAADTILAQLQADMVAKIAALNAEYGGWALENIVNWYTAELPSIPAYPSVLVLGDSSEIVGEGASWVKAKHTMTIACVVTDQDTQRLRQRLYRYIRAIFEILKESRATLGYEVVFEGFEYSPMFGAEGTFLMDARIIITVAKYESG